jgi:metallo-beta-lactamase class B
MMRAIRILREAAMRLVVVALVSASVAGLAAGVFAQLGTDVVDAHIAAAKSAAGQYHPGLFNSLCSPTSIRPAAAPQRGQAPNAAQSGPPERATWRAEPVKAFDNLYYVGEKEYSAWAVNTSDGIIIIDTIFDYSVEDEIAGGLKKLGLDPAKIKYAVVSHGHFDHFGGAKYLQDRFGARVLMSAADWEFVAQSNSRGEKPRRDMVITDGQKLTLGDTTLTFYLTPGHTLGTVSTLIPVKDGGQPHLVAEWGGTGFNFPRSPERFKTYIESAERFRDLATKAGADALISNHTNLDGSKLKMPLLAQRKPGDPHPYVIGTEAVRGYLTVASECASAALEAMK